MKKTIALLLTLAMLLTGLVTVSSAIETDMEFSMKGDSGKVGDTVEVEVYLDKNKGTWAALFEIYFDSSALKLKDVENGGEVFTKSQFTKAPLDKDGYYRYYGQMDDPTENNTKTGLLCTLTFQIKENATNGEHSVWLVFPDHGDGWFFTVNGDNFDSLTVPDDGAVSTVVKVSGSTAAETTANSKTLSPENPVPETTAATDKTSDDAETKTSVTVAVTDSEGAPVTDEEGKLETETAEGDEKDYVYFETDAEGAPVTDAEGEWETYRLDESGNKVTEHKAEDEKTDIKTILLIAGIAAAVIAAVIIIIVAVGGKNDKKKEENENVNTLTDDGNNGDGNDGINN